MCSLCSFRLYSEYGLSIIAQGHVLGSTFWTHFLTVVLEALKSVSEIDEETRSVWLKQSEHLSFLWLTIPL